MDKPTIISSLLSSISGFGGFDSRDLKNFIITLKVNKDVKINKKKVIKKHTWFGQLYLKLKYGEKG